MQILARLTKREFGIIFEYNQQNKHWVYWDKTDKRSDKKKYDKTHFVGFLCLLYVKSKTLSKISGTDSIIPLFAK